MVNGKNYELLVMLKEGPQRRRVLRTVADAETPVGSKGVSEETGVTQSNVVRVLNELEAKGAVRELTGRQRNRLYEVTDKGLRSLKAMEDLS